MSRSVIRKLSRTISGGTITIPTGPRWVRFWHIEVDTENGDANDNLDAILGGKVGDRITLRIKQNSHKVTVRDDQPVGPDKIEGQGNFLLDQVKDRIEVERRNQNVWDELGRSPN